MKVSLLATGPHPLTYQWLKDGKPITREQYPNFTGINSSMLEIDPFLPAYVGSYKCVVSHMPSEQEVETSTARLLLGMFLISLKLLSTHK